jgi:acetyl-CoA carboxylase carboxyl transferase subunit beta
MSWLTRLIERPKSIISGNSDHTPDGLWIKCSGCDETLYNKELMRSDMV